MLEKHPDILSPELIAQILGASRKTVMKRLKEGAIKSFRDGKSYLVLKEDLIAYIYQKRATNDALMMSSDYAIDTVDTPDRNNLNKRK